MKTAFKISVVLLILMASPLFGQEEERSGKIGFIFMEKDGGSFANIGLTFGIPNSFAFEPIFGFERISLEGISGTEYQFGLGIINYLSQRSLSPYLGIRFQGNILSAGGETIMDKIFSLAFGAEYFFSKWFSLGGEYTINYISTDPDFSPNYPTDANLYNTDRKIILRLYLK